VEQIEALYDAAKSKSFKLNNLSRSITPEGFEKQLVEGRINGVLISMQINTINSSFEFLIT